MGVFEAFFLGAVIAFFVLSVAIQWSGGWLLFINIPSILIVLGLTFFMMITTLGLKEFLNGLKSFVVIFKEDIPPWVSKMDIYIIQKIQWYLLISGIIGSVIGIVGMLANLEDPKVIGPSLAVGLLTIFYSLFLTMFFCQPALYRLRNHFSQSLCSDHKIEPLGQKKTVNETKNSIRNKNGFSFSTYLIITLSTMLMVFLLADEVNELEKKILLFQSGESTEAIKKSSFSYTLKPLIVNISKEKNIFEHYLHIEISLIPNNDSLYIELERRNDQILDTILTILSSKTPAMLLSKEGKNFLREEIKAEINSFLLAGEIKQVYFRSLTIK